jgi:hypothetical protein
MIRILELILVRLSTLVLVAGIMVSISVATSAQDANPNAGNVPYSDENMASVKTIALVPPEPAAGQGVGGAPAGSSGSRAWQAAFGYQLNGIRLFTADFHTNGFNISLARYFDSLFGVEVQTGFGFGNTGSATTPHNLAAKSVFAGGGPRIAVNRSGRIEPWAHGIVGLEYFRFTQTSPTLGSNSTLGWETGGGVDLNVNAKTAFRVEGDYLGTRFFGLNHSNYQVVVGVAFNF